MSHFQYPVIKKQSFLKISAEMCNSRAPNLLKKDTLFRHARHGAASVFHQALKLFQ